jgi:uncharacterized delta-60 repeat protein
MEPLPQGVTVEFHDLSLQASAAQLAMAIEVAAEAPLGTFDTHVIARGAGGSERRQAVRLRIADPGALDPSWGNEGAVSLAVRPGETLADLALDDAGRLQVSLQKRVGEGLRVVRFTHEGALDTDFGTGGSAEVGPMRTGILLAQDDGLLVAAAQDTDTMVVRLLGDGSLDESFGEGGIARIADVGEPVAIHATSERIVVAGNGDELFVASLDHAGKVLSRGARTFGLDRTVRGLATADAVYFAYDAPDEAGGHYDAHLLKSRDDGTADLSFGTGGEVQRSAASYTALAADADDIVTCGVIYMPTTFMPILERFDATGAPDRSFGSWGNSQPLPKRGVGSCWDVAAAGDGLVALVGATSMSEVPLELHLLTADGDPDTAFGDGGSVAYSSRFLDTSAAVAADREGVVLGFTAGDQLHLRRHLL